MTVYEQLLKDDFVQYFEKEFADGRVRFDADGKIKEFCRLSKDILWLCTKEMEMSPINRRCNVYLTYFFNNLGFIHSKCHECWKVVVKPKTIVQLFKLYDIQKEMKVPAKCGVEQRPYVKSYYGGYFYTRSKEEGKEMYKRVRKMVDDNFSPDIEVILKRGCTEYEMRFGRSDKWELLPNQLEWEKRFDEIYVVDLKAPYDVPDYLVANIKRKWIEFAANQKIPDETYKELTGGRALRQEVDYITYHNEESIFKPKLRLVEKP